MFYMGNVEQLLIIITSVDEKASVKYSTDTGKFFVSSDIWYKEEKNFRNVAEHKNTVHEAITSFYRIIQGKTIKLYNKEDEYKLPILIKDYKKEE